MDEQTEREFQEATKNMYLSGGTRNVIECLIEMFECQLVISKTLRELLKNQRDT